MTQFVESNSKFWNTLVDLFERHPLVIDRPKGTSHPRYPTLIYPLDYGYLSGTKSGDGEDIDVWIGSDISLGLSGVLCSIDIGKSDAEVKLLLGCNPDEIDTIIHFNDQFMRYLFIPKP